MTERMSADERVQRGVGRSVGNLAIVLIVLVLLGAWGVFGIYTVEVGQHAIVLRFGGYVRTEVREGLHFRLPPPVERVEIVSVESVQREEFGLRPG